MTLTSANTYAIPWYNYYRSTLFYAV